MQICRPFSSLMIILLLGKPFASCLKSWVRSCASRRSTVVTPFAKTEAASPDLIILDLGMPGMNGFEAATILHKTKPQVPLFMLTSHDRREVESQAALAGIRAVFSKCTDTQRTCGTGERIVTPFSRPGQMSRECPSLICSAHALPYPLPTMCGITATR